MKKCELSFCANLVPLAEIAEDGAFCKKCRDAYSPKALGVMRYFQVGLAEALVNAAKLFPSAQGISDYFGVSLPTLYAWIRTYHKLSFRQFKRKYICSSRTCIVIDNCAHYAWKYTVADRVHDRGGCICFIENSDNLIMTTLASSTVAEMLRAEVQQDVHTGVHRVRYPVRLFQLRTSAAVDPDDADADVGRPSTKSRKRKRSA